MPAAGSDDPQDFVGGDPTLGAAPPLELTPLDAHAVLGIDPAHGPFRGGQLALIRGNGFSSSARVWFGDVEVSPDQLTATRSDRLQLTVPPGAPGAVPITIQNGDDAASRRTLDAAYRYDAFFAEPEQGPTSGGSIITLVGANTAWDMGSMVSIDREPCEVIAVRGEKGGAQELDCRTAAGTEGQKSISIAAGGATATVLGGFSYEPGVVESGGFSGQPLVGRLGVRVTAPGGSPIAGAYVILGSVFDPAALGQPGSALQQTDSSGSATLTGDFAAPPTVTVAARCFQPITFVAVPVDTLNAQLSPVASPDCIDDSPLNFGGSPTPPVIIKGELVWQGAVEFQRAGWTNVPAPAREGERRAAYVIAPSQDAEARFRLPREDSAVTLDSDGQAGYAFQVVTGAGSRTFYALAGVENRAVNPPQFTAYTLGLLRGLYADPGETIEGVAIAMNRTLDQAITLDVVGPAISTRGPDHVDLRVAVQLARGGFAVLPNATLAFPLPGSGSLDLIGLPALVGDLAGGQYAVGARAVTGQAGAMPLSVLPVITARDTSASVRVSGFVPVPTLTVGSSDQIRWNRELGVTWTDTGRSVDLVLYEIQSGQGLITWSVVAPPVATNVALPDLSRLPEGDLLPGPVDVTVSLASVPDFDYAKLQTDQLGRFAWEAYAADVDSTRYERTAP